MKSLLFVKPTDVVSYMCADIRFGLEWRDQALKIEQYFQNCHLVVWGHCYKYASPVYFIRPRKLSQMCCSSLWVRIRIHIYATMVLAKYLKRYYLIVNSFIVGYRRMYELILLWLVHKSIVIHSSLSISIILKGGSQKVSSLPTDMINGVC